MSSPDPDSASEAGVPLIEAEFDTLSTSKKRKREATDGATPEDKKAAKKAKRKQKKKLLTKNIDEGDLDTELSVNRAFEKMDAPLLADYVNARTRLYGKELSSVELEDRFVSARTLRDTTTYTSPRTLDNLAPFLKHHAKHIQAVPKDSRGAPHTLFISPSGQRAADVFKALRTGLPKIGIRNPNVAKLFAKHMKIKEQIENLEKYKVDFGVGTPDRLAALLDQKALSTKYLRRVVVDVSYIDQKKRGILDMKELHEPLIKLLLREEFKEAGAGYEEEKKSDGKGEEKEKEKSKKKGAKGEEKEKEKKNEGEGEALFMFY